MELFKIKWHGFHQNVQTIHKTKDSDAIFVQLLSVLYKLAQHYYTNKMLFPTVHFMYLSPKTASYWQRNCSLVFNIISVDAQCDGLVPEWPL